MLVIFLFCVLFLFTLLLFLTLVLILFPAFVSHCVHPFLQYDTSYLSFPTPHIVSYRCQALYRIGARLLNLRMLVVKRFANGLSKFLGLPTIGTDHPTNRTGAADHHGCHRCDWGDNSTIRYVAPTCGRPITDCVIEVGSAHGEEFTEAPMMGSR